MNRTPTVPRTDTNERADALHVYHVTRIIEAKSAFVYVAYEQNSLQQKVLKVLRNYADERYNYSTQSGRLACQQEALRKNSEITQDIYQGLGRIVYPTLGELEELSRKDQSFTITLASIVRENDQVERLPRRKGEYALVMSYLPEEQRLDLLLQAQKENPTMQREYLSLLAERIEQMHRELPPPGTIGDKDGNAWGNHQQLFKKLEHNLAYFDLITRDEPKLYKQYKHLKVSLEHLIQQSGLQEAFKIRQSKYIKQCHGDLKTQNIWIETNKQDNDPLQCVRILDAVDFNEFYRNIDVLADLAMLAVDVIAHGGKDLGDYLIKQYLKFASASQTEEQSYIEPEEAHAAKIVLTYYLLEKAIVCAIMCLVIDRSEKQLGAQLLRLADEYASELEQIIEGSHSEDSQSNFQAA
jgi:aminoglycoside phosphotransferase family enzyme